MNEINLNSQYKWNIRIPGKITFTIRWIFVYTWDLYGNYQLHIYLTFEKNSDFRLQYTIEL